MSNHPPRQLSADDIGALKFAAYRQLARLGPKAAVTRQRAQRTALARVVRRPRLMPGTRSSAN
jgi:hypothetical protein